MKFTVNNDHQANALMNTLLSGLLLFILLFLTADMVAKAEHYGHTPSKIAATLNGDEASYIDPLPFGALLEGVHADIFFAMMTLLVLGAVYGRVGRSKKLRIVLVNMMMASSLVALVSPLMAVFVSSVWVLVGYITFILWHLIAIVVALIASWRLRFP